MKPSLKIHLQSGLIQTRKEEQLQMYLAAIAGYVDAFGLIRFKTYLSFMSGNTTQSGNLLATGNLNHATLAITAIISFFCGVFLSTVATSIKSNKIAQMPFIPVVFGLALFLILDACFNVNPIFSVALIGTAMGYMNTTATHVGRQTINPDFVTGTLSSMAKHLAAALIDKYPTDAQGTWDTHLRRYFLLLLVWISFICGAISSTIGHRFLNNWVLLLPITVLICLTLKNIKNKTLR